MTKIVAYIASVLISLAVFFAGAIALTLTAKGSPSSLLIFLGIVPLTVMVNGPLLLGSLVAFWDVTRSDKARAFFRRWVIGVIIAQSVSAIAIIVDVVLGGTSWWVAIVFIAAGIALTILAVVIGNTVRHSEERRVPEAVEVWQLITPADVRRKIRSVILTFFIGLVAAVVIFGAVDLTSRRPARLLGLLPTVLEFPLFAAAIACIVVALPLGRQLRETADGDLGRMRSFARAVLKGKSDELSASEELGAARYASAISLFLRFQVAYFVLLYAGLVLQQVSSLIEGQLGGTFPLVFLAALVVILVALLPIQIRRIQRARRYAAAHGDLLAA